MDTWDDVHVKMPCSNGNLFPIDDEVSAGGVSCPVYLFTINITDPDFVQRYAMEMNFFKLLLISRILNQISSLSFRGI